MDGGRRTDKAGPTTSKDSKDTLESADFESAEEDHQGPLAPPLSEGAEESPLTNQSRGRTSIVDASGSATSGSASGSATTEWQRNLPPPLKPSARELIQKLRKAKLATSDKVVVPRQGTLPTATLSEVVAPPTR